MTIEVEGPVTGKASLLEPVLRALPDWFGIEESIQNYLRDMDVMPTFIAREGKEILGFLTVKKHFENSAELIVMGVYPEMHRQGAGKKLLEKAEDYFRSQGVEFLHVKTLSSTHPDPFYKKTREFYTAMGFQPLLELPTLWDRNNPCLILIKRISQPQAS
jgi:GNAT superfamily N-acetyltransferase